MACELLVYIGDGRRHGVIVGARNVPHRGWGRDERPPLFTRVRVTDRSAQQLEFLSRGTRFRLSSRFRLDFANMRPDIKRAALASPTSCRVRWRDVEHALCDEERAIRGEWHSDWAVKARE